MDYIEEHGGMDVYIEDPFDMIWDYQNYYVTEFGVKWMGYVNYKMQDTTGIDLFNAFFNTDDYPQDSQGNIIGVNKLGKVCKIADPHSTRTRLRIIK